MSEHSIYSFGAFRDRTSRKSAARQSLGQLGGYPHSSPWSGNTRFKDFEGSAYLLTQMVNIFAKTRKKSSRNPSPTKSDEPPTLSRASSASPPPSPEKKSYPIKDKDRERDRHRASPTKRSRKPHATKEPQHPLNLPPEERKRLSAMSAASDPLTPQPMDIDREQTASPGPASPSPAPVPPGAFPQTNGVNGTKDHEERPPTPPLHRTQTAPSTEDAESHKAAGNKFFKAKEYDKAIAEYTKGEALAVHGIVFSTVSNWKQPSK